MSNFFVEKCMDKKHILFWEQYFVPSVDVMCIEWTASHWKSFWQTVLGILYLFLQNEKIFA